MEENKQVYTPKVWMDNHGAIHKEEVGRNELCPCGSGKKYKKCCMNKDKNYL